MENLNPIDKSVREAVSAYLSAHPEAFGGFGKHRLTAIGGLQPTSPSPIAHAVGPSSLQRGISTAEKPTL